MRKQTLAILGIAAALVVAGGTAYAIDQDATAEQLIGNCPPGSHFKVEVTHPNGDTDTLVIKRDVRKLPPGTEIAGNGIVVNRDGEVAVHGGEARLTCIE